MTVMSPIVAPFLTHAPTLHRCRILCASFARLLGRPLLARIPVDDRALGQALYDAPVVIVSHGTEPDPVFWFANRAAQRLWELDWERFTRLPSRLSAEPDERTTREALLQRVAAHGFIDDYGGVRVSATGRRFRIAQAVVWNLVDAQGMRIGQAATFASWEHL